MKALTVLEPFSSLLGLTAKEYETRSWRTNYRGPVAIHAGKSMAAWHLNLAWKEPLFSALAPQHDEYNGKIGIKYPFGKIIAIADLVDIIRMTPEFIASVSSRERAFGDWEEGRFAWKMANVRRIDPVPARGKQGLWNWDWDCVKEEAS